MNAETRALIEILRDETQSRSVFDRCNAVLAVASDIKMMRISPDQRTSNPRGEFWVRDGVFEIYADEAEVEIIKGEKR